MRLTSDRRKVGKVQHTLPREEDLRDVVMEVEESEHSEVEVQQDCSIVKDNKDINVLKEVKEDQDVLDPQREPLNVILRQIGLFEDSDPSPESKEKATKVIIQHFKTERRLFQW